MIKNKFLNFILILATPLLIISGCKKPLDTIAIITVVDINGTPVEGAHVRLHQDGQVSSAGYTSIVSDEQWTDGNGKTEHVFENEAILQVDINKSIGNLVITGSNMIALRKEKTVRKTFQID